MSLTIHEDGATIQDHGAFIQNEINLVIQNQELHRELTWALSILTRESQERVAGILRRKEWKVTMLDLEELLLEPV